MQPQVAEFLTKGLPGDPQQPSSLVLIAAGVLQTKRQQEPVYLAVGVGVEVLSFRPEPSADECFQASSRRLNTHHPTTHQIVGQESRQQDRTARLQQGLLQDTLQLPDVPRPGIAAQPL